MAADIQPGQYWTKDSTGEPYQVLKVDSFTVEIKTKDWNLAFWERRLFSSHFTLAD